MTDCLATLPSNPTSRASAMTVRSRRTRPRGVPGWLWLLGVTVQPIGPERPDGSRPWAVSAGVGPGHVAAFFVDHPEQHREDQP